MKPRLIAFYLPQFYPTPENDEWWGKGFTEWTNVGRAKPLFKGHYQPKVPADLGYYDLRIPEIREEQAKMAREAGIEGFCYWHYWFGNGKRLLSQVFKEVVESGKPDFPFCLCWANHSWLAKTWDPSKPPRMLMEQTYPGVNDYIAHFNEMLPAFMDERYIRVDGKLLFGLFAPLDMPEIDIFKDTWNDLAKSHGLGGFKFFGYMPSPKNSSKVLEKFDYVTTDYYAEAITSKDVFVKRCLKWINSHILHRPYVGLYSDYVNYTINRISDNKRELPCLLPNYDHTPRSGKRGLLLHKSTPKLFAKLLMGSLRKRENISADENLIFLKAWNEWGEGNYLEPDLKYGNGYLKAIKNVLDSIE